MLTWQHSGFSVDASVRISLADQDVPGYFQSLEHLLRYCARPAFALDRLSVVPGTGNSPERVRYTLPRHKRGTGFHTPQAFQVGIDIPLYHLRSRH